MDKIGWVYTYELIEDDLLIIAFLVKVKNSLKYEFDFFLKEFCHKNEIVTLCRENLKEKVKEFEQLLNKWKIEVERILKNTSFCDLILKFNQFTKIYSNLNEIIDYNFEVDEILEISPPYNTEMKYNTAGAHSPHNPPSKRGLRQMKKAQAHMQVDGENINIGKSFSYFLLEFI